LIQGLWLITGAVLFIWTLGMVALAQLAPWFAGQLSQWSVAWPAWADWPWPPWLNAWLEPAWLSALAAWLSPVLQALLSVLPSWEGLGKLLGLLVWLVWALGLLLWLLLALLVHRMLRRRRPRVLP